MSFAQPYSEGRRDLRCPAVTHSAWRMAPMLEELQQARPSPALLGAAGAPVGIVSVEPTAPP